MKTVNSTARMCLLGSLTFAVAAAGLTTRAANATVVQCGSASCSTAFSVSVDGVDIGGSNLVYDAATGQISMDTTNVRGGGVVQADGSIYWQSGDNHVTVRPLTGNADPILGFGLGATTGAAGSTFAFAFNLPISLSGSILASSSFSYSLTALSSAGADLRPLGTGPGARIVTADERDTSVGGLPTFNKGVDVGTALAFAGLGTQNSSVFTANNTFTTTTAYDLMSVLVGFQLSANSTTGMSGFVQQVNAVPIPAALPLLLSGIGGLFVAVRRRVGAPA